MPTLFTHALVGGMAGISASRWSCFNTPRLWVLSVILALLPDLDGMAFYLGISYSHPWGHRGMLHSLVFALAIGGLASILFFRGERWQGRHSALAAYFSLVAASHPLLDALTNGGLGVALLAPFSNQRLFFPFTPIAVSPLSLSRLFSSRGWPVLISEAVWIWLPISLLTIVIWWIARQSNKPSHTD